MTIYNLNCIIIIIFNCTRAYARGYTLVYIIAEGLTRCCHVRKKGPLKCWHVYNLNTPYSIERRSQRETVHKGHVGMRETKSFKEKKISSNSYFSDLYIPFFFLLLLMLSFSSSFPLIFWILFGFSFLSSYFFFLSTTILWQFLLKGRTTVAVKNCFNIK